jgi:hypothetical protein
VRRPAGKKSSAACHTGPIHLVMSSGIDLTKETIVTSRLNPFAAAPAPMQSWLDFGKAILQSGRVDRDRSSAGAG